MKYQAYFNPNALKLHKWALEEDNRVKSSKLMKIATDMEDKCRKYGTHNSGRGNHCPSPTWKPPLPPVSQKANIKPTDKEIFNMIITEHEYNKHIIYDKIQRMSQSELATFLVKVFDTQDGSICPIGVGCGSCIDYGTHHHPEDCIRDKCKYVNIGKDYEKWLSSDWSLIEEELEDEDE